MSEVRQFPMCAECSLRHGGWWPVEEYEVAWEKPTARGCRATCVVIAKCSHGHGPDNWERHAQAQRSRFQVPYWWGNGHVIDAIRDLKFFVPGGDKEVMHSLVERFS